MSDEYMNDELFAELLESVGEGGAILRGEKQASRIFKLELADVKGVREQIEVKMANYTRVVSQHRKGDDPK